MAILNQRDYRLAKARLAQLREAFGHHAVIRNLASGTSTEIADARRAALNGEDERLRQEVDAYEKLRGRQTVEDSNLDTTELGLLPIVGRIARGLSQRQLADLLEIKEQQVQRYESERYETVSLARFKKILDILKIEMGARLLEFNFDSAIGAPIKESQLEFKPEIIREIQKRKWIEVPTDTPAKTFVQLIDLYVQEGLKLSKGASFDRKNLRENSNYDELALLAWKARILKAAKATRATTKANFNIIRVEEWLPDLVSLSVHADGPLRATKFLSEQGIIVVAEPHLPNTHLDGAALRLADATPVIGLTLRYDRLDHFWFTLLHELGHACLHFNRGLDEGFFDNLLATDKTDREREADSFARSTLIPDEIWAAAPARFAKSVDLLKKFSAMHGIHISIVAGRIRRERDNYMLFSEWVGEGQVRRLFWPDSA